jgi:hypothetical protein
MLDTDVSLVRIPHVSVIIKLREIAWKDKKIRLFRTASLVLRNVVISLFFLNTREHATDLIP